MGLRAVLARPVVQAVPLLVRKVKMGIEKDQVIVKIRKVIEEVSLHVLLHRNQKENLPIVEVHRQGVVVLTNEKERSENLPRS